MTGRIFATNLQPGDDMIGLNPMRPNVVRRSIIVSIVDLAIGLTLCLTAAYFLLVMEYRLTQGELTHAQLLLLGTGARAKRSHHRPAEIEKSKNQGENDHGGSKERFRATG